MKKILLSICILFSSKLILAQVGIGTVNPNILLEITEERNNEINDINSKDGLLIPSLTKIELASKNINIYNSLSHGTLVYVSQVDEISTNLPSVNQVVEILNPGFYYFDGIKNKWISTVGDTSVDIWSNNKLNHYMELNGTSSEGNRIANSNVIINDKGYLGINSNYPTQDTGPLDPNDLNDPIDSNKPNDPKKRLDIDASIPGKTTDFIKIRNLNEINSNINSSTLVIDQFGNIYKNDVENLNGQIMRIPISGFTVGTNTNATQGSLRLDFDKSTISPACIQNGIKICDLNFINTIKGVTANELISNETLTANTGTVPRITDRIKLPKGVYKIQIRLDGNYDNIVETNGNTIVKLAVGNREFSVHNYYDNIVGPNETSIIFTDYINLNQDDFVDFLMDNWNNKKFVITPHVNQGTIPNPNYNPSLPISENNVLNYNSKIIKSMVLIERLR